MAIEALALRARQVPAAVHLSFVAALASALVLQVISDTGGPARFCSGRGRRRGAVRPAYRRFGRCHGRFRPRTDPLIGVGWFLFRLAGVGTCLSRHRRSRGRRQPGAAIGAAGRFRCVGRVLRGRDHGFERPDRQVPLSEFRQLGGILHVVPEREQRGRQYDTGGTSNDDGRYRPPAIYRPRVTTRAASSACFASRYSMDVSEPVTPSVRRNMRKPQRGVHLRVGGARWRLICGSSPCTPFFRMDFDHASDCRPAASGTFAEQGQGPERIQRHTSRIGDKPHRRMAPGSSLASNPGGGGLAQFFHALFPHAGWQLRTLGQAVHSRGSGYTWAERTRSGRPAGPRSKWPAALPPSGRARRQAVGAADQAAQGDRAIRALARGGDRGPWREFSSGGSRRHFAPEILQTSQTFPFS